MLGFANAIDFAVDIATEGFNDKVIVELAQWYADQGEAAAAAAAS